MKAIEQWLELTGQTQQELAKRSKVRPDELNRWMHRRATPSIRALKRLSKGTGIPLEKLAADF